VDQPCLTQVEIIRTSETSSEVLRIRWLREWTLQAAGLETLIWDGRNDQGLIVQPGSYSARVQATHGEAARNAFATGWLTVRDDKPTYTSYLPLVLS
jgi:hypothetical protein